MKACDEELLKRARELRQETGTGSGVIAKVLGVGRTCIPRWDNGVMPRDRAKLARYLIILRALEHHCEIEESRHEREAAGPAD
jgi:predicted transcriptional regulator